jgi:hypothetical protein
VATNAVEESCLDVLSGRAHANSFKLHRISDAELRELELHINGKGSA